MTGSQDTNTCNTDWSLVYWNVHTNTYFWRIWKTLGRRDPPYIPAPARTFWSGSPQGMTWGRYRPPLPFSKHTHTHTVILKDRDVFFPEMYPTKICYLLTQRIEEWGGQQHSGSYKSAKREREHWCTHWDSRCTWDHNYKSQDSGTSVRYFHILWR